MPPCIGLIPTHAREARAGVSDTGPRSWRWGEIAVRRRCTKNGVESPFASSSAPTTTDASMIVRILSAADAGASPTYLLQTAHVFFLLSSPTPECAFPSPPISPNNSFRSTVDPRSGACFQSNEGPRGMVGVWVLRAPATKRGAPGPVAHANDATGGVFLFLSHAHTRCARFSSSFAHVRKPSAPAHRAMTREDDPSPNATQWHETKRNETPRNKAPK